jgi:hypothetical protein
VLAAFWSGLGGELAKNWAARVLTPAFAFWTGGLALVWWDYHGDDVRKHGWTAELQATTHPFEQLDTTIQVILIVAALILVAASALVAERLTLPLLKLLEGYWTRPAWLRNLLIAYRRWRWRRWLERVEPLRIKQRRGNLTFTEERELRDLEAQPALTEQQIERLRKLRERAARFSAQELDRLMRGESFLRATPPTDPLRMPTRLGDALRAAERRPYEKYGLDTVICWYRLWMLLPTEAKTDIAEARLELDRAVRASLWGALFLVWTPWLWWVALPIGLVVPFLAYNVSMLSAAALFGDLVESAFDLYRMRLYDAALLSRPTSAADERQHGAQLTAILWRGETDPAVVYVKPKPASDDEDDEA